MNGHRRRFLASAVALAAGFALAGVAEAHSWPHPTAARGALASMEIVDRGNNGELYVYEKDGQRYVIGTPGAEYTVRIRNLTGGRILAVTSVDGVNVVTGETASPDQSGYVLEPWASVDISGWRKSLQATAAFYFTEHANSYAARTGRPNDVGVIGLAVFREREFRAQVWPKDRIASAAGARGDAPASNAAPLPAAPMPRQEAARDAAREADAQSPAAAGSVDARSRPAEEKAMAKLGTGHGRVEDSAATRVRFDRASTTPAETIAVRYDRRENLVALGVLPRSTPRYAGTPNPFPAAPGFVPDPPTR